MAKALQTSFSDPCDYNRNTVVLAIDDRPKKVPPPARKTPVGVQLRPDPPGSLVKRKRRTMPLLLVAFIACSSMFGWKNASVREPISLGPTQMLVDREKLRSPSAVAQRRGDAGIRSDAGLPRRVWFQDLMVRRKGVRPGVSA